MADQATDAPALGSVRTAERQAAGQDPGVAPAGQGPDAASATPDRATLRLALVVGGLVLAVLLGFGLGRINGGGGASAAGGTDSALADHTHAPGLGAHSHGADQDAAAEAGGLAVSRDGYTLTPLAAEFTPGQAGELRFQIRNGQRRAVTRFAVVHDKPMHVIVVRRDLSGYQHLHPTMAEDGTWSVPLTLPSPGVWRAYADFTALADDGRQTATTLGVDLVAPGDYTPRDLPTASTTTTVDGFTVDYQGVPQPGLTVPLSFRIAGADGGAPALERYLGAYGHLVALREGDLGYLHVHPEPELIDGTIRFWLTTPGPGRYRLYLDFATGGAVRTAEFTVSVP
ncbi:hypothetical protein GCM10029963_55770 [Micromonospora andamanensis]|uniref:hypothetical protein n=1 Tax=Micromonospora andamanensis TaxID=1287068 RepID=UPI001A3729C5|nr:hypothetical protein [Micromonospora andamanensis]GIJ36900.1 hypothetical protein Vwe01_02250 [Micromonospora andamanensis]